MPVLLVLAVLVMATFFLALSPLSFLSRSLSSLFSLSFSHSLIQYYICPSIVLLSLVFLGSLSFSLSLTHTTSAVFLFFLFLSLSVLSLFRFLSLSLSLSLWSFSLSGFSRFSLVLSLSHTTSGFLFFFFLSFSLSLFSFSLSLSLSLSLLSSSPGPPSPGPPPPPPPPTPPTGYLQTLVLANSTVVIATEHVTVKVYFDLNAAHRDGVAHLDAAILHVGWWVRGGRGRRGRG